MRKNPESTFRIIYNIYIDVQMFWKTTTAVRGANCKGAKITGFARQKFQN